MKCRPGDLCIVMDAPLCPQLVNRFVIVEGRAMPGSRFAPGWVFEHDDEDRDVWFIVSATDGEMLPIGIDGQVQWVPRVPLRDRYLRPIRDYPRADIEVEADLPQPRGGIIIHSYE